VHPQTEDYWGNVTKARSVLGWEPKMPLKHGLLSTITYFDELLSGDANAAPAERIRTRSE
jgi:hypothetical protein